MNLLSNSCQQTGKKSVNGKNGPTHEPRYRKKIFYYCDTTYKLCLPVCLFYGCQRNARKNITVTVSVRVSVTVRVSLV